ncbi:STAS domain-containing protein [Blastococcus aurantiacus]|uniref:STAS domain-containing protein n=1 Tax=Blastococcus aurantiacus TaxID=1550231 RepID=UPI0015A2B1F0|nr:STAS domain-containing protein [Blastococcus aurantiacus]
MWEALTAVLPYCPVCDVSYVFSGATDDRAGSRMRKGMRFVCVPGRLDGAPPPQDAVAGVVVDWVAQRSVGTRLEVASETWRTGIELADAGEGSTRVTVTVTHESRGGNGLVRALQRKALRRTVQQTVDSELMKLPDHIRQATKDSSGSSPVERGSSSFEREATGRVLHLRGEVDAPTVRRLQLPRVLEESEVVAIDVRELAYIDSSAFAPLLRWAQRTSRAGRRAVIRGTNPGFDETLGVMGLTSAFIRER